MKIVSKSSGLSAVHFLTATEMDVDLDDYLDKALTKHTKII
jgi:hypothetical protein